MSGYANNARPGSQIQHESIQEPHLTESNLGIVHVTGVQAPDAGFHPSDGTLEASRRAPMLPELSRTWCIVPGCLIPNCKLRTHRKYKPAHSARIHTWQQTYDQAPETLKSLLLSAPQGPSSEGVDGFPRLPIQESLDVTTRSLFHYFFTNAFDKLALLFRGPSVGDMAPFKERMLGAALSSEAYCRALILQASTEQERQARGQSVTKEALNLYGKALTAFRELLAAIRQTPHPLQIELGLLITCILVMYNIAHDNKEALQVHWQGLRDLVLMRGGMHHVTTALAYVVHTDRACAVQFDSTPACTGTPVQPLPMPWMRSFRYESKFEALKQHPIGIDTEVLNYLEEVSRLVSLWEPYRAYTYGERIQRSVTSLDCLYYVRDRLDERFALLNARWAEVNSIERCMLSASRIVEYPITWSNYVQGLTNTHCRRLETFLQQQNDLAGMIDVGMDVLKWMGFGVIVVDEASLGRPWVVNFVQDQLVKKYGTTPWRSTWWIEEQENLMAFTWSTQYYSDRFVAVCHKLEQRCPRFNDSRNEHAT